MRQTPRGLTLLALALLPLAGCPKRKDAPAASARLPFYEIAVHDRTAPADRLAGLTQAMLDDWVKQRLSGSSSVQPGAKRGPGGYQLQVEVGVAFRTEEGDAKPQRVVLASARAAAPDSLDAPALQASTVVPFRSLGGAEADRSAVKDVLDGVLDDLLYQAELTVAPPQRLAAALAEKDPTRLAAAVEIAAVRRTREAVPALLRLLHHEDERVADRAIGALVAIGDRRAVKPLTRLADFKDTARMAKLLDAIGSLGGPEAKEYLEFVASGHDDADIRNLASEALERMNRQGQK